MVSTPQVANEKRIENTATMTIRLVASARLGRVTLFLNSSTDSFIYVIMPCVLKSVTIPSAARRRINFSSHLPLPCSSAREERLELPTPGFGDQCSTN